MKLRPIAPWLCLALGLAGAAATQVGAIQAQVGTRPRQARGAPSPAFSMVQTGTTVQTLANGLIITGTEQIRTWRNAAGVTRTDTEHFAGDHVVRAPGKPAARAYLAEVFDPATGTAADWSTVPGAVKVVRISYVDGFDGTDHVDGVDSTDHTARIPRYGASRMKKLYEDLPPRVVAGTQATGTRRKRTYPAGSKGNNLEYTSVYEDWRSPKYDISLETTTDDPSFGKSTLILNSFTPGTPDPALFLPPAEYKVIEERKR